MKNKYLISSALSLSLILTACGSSSSSDKKTESSFDVTVTNLTVGQPMSPILVAYHNENTTLFEIGKSSSLALEELAEGGANSTLLTSLTNNSNVYVAKSGTAVIAPGASEKVSFTNEHTTKCISVVSMLVNTNDGFAGQNCIDISNLSTGESMNVPAVVYDAGTEENTESNTTVPGQGGDGFNTQRTENNGGFIRVHSGVISKDDGLSTSALTINNKWDNPAMKITITRTK